MQPKERFVLETEEYRDPDQSKGTWSQLLCKVIEVQPDGSRKQIGDFIRSYSCLYDTWEPFEQNGKFFALCSREYTATSVMALPECKIIAEETPHSYGFCPTGFYVPTETKRWINDDKPEPLPEEWSGQIGFVCGCIWGDDTGWKIEFLDLSEITEGRITRDNRFGYIELPGDSDSLSEFVFISDSTDDFPDHLIIKIAHKKLWSGALKWKADGKVPDEKIDLNTMADEMTKHILGSIEYGIGEKEEIPEKLQTKEFREDIRDTMIAYLGRFAGGVK